MNVHSLPSALPSSVCPWEQDLPHHGAAGPGSLHKGPRACAGTDFSLTPLKSGSLWGSLGLQRPSKLGFCLSSQTLQSLPSQISVGRRSGVDWESTTSIVTGMGTVVVTLLLMVSAARDAPCCPSLAVLTHFPGLVGGPSQCCFLGAAGGALGTFLLSQANLNRC